MGRVFTANKEGEIRMSQEDIGLLVLFFTVGSTVIVGLFTEWSETKLYVLVGCLAIGFIISFVLVTGVLPRKNTRAQKSY